ncbi:MAG: nuclear transport factor 2 family protein [Spirochaetales bacterium]|nr:nuclear transport factor 2 family protein [Spirochaetales bacterium]
MQITKEVVLDLWSKTYNTEGKPDWEHIFPYYSPDIIFQDSIQKIEGKDEFVKMCNRLTARCKELKMEIVNISQNDNVIIFDWIMTMMFKKYPSTPMYGATKLVINETGLITHQRDYYDMWGDIFNNIPLLGKIYRKILKKRFG